MHAFIADDTLRVQDLRSLVDRTTIFDGEGKVLGVFVPAGAECCGQVAVATAPISLAEAERMVAAEPSIPSEEVFARLKELDAEIERRKAVGEPALTNEQAVACMNRPRSTTNVPAVAIPTENAQCGTR